MSKQLHQTGANEQQDSNLSRVLESISQVRGEQHQEQEHAVALGNTVPDGESRPPSTPINEAELLARITAIVRKADAAFESAGGGSRHWVRDHFLPTLNAAGLIVVEAPRMWCQHCREEIRLVDGVWIDCETHSTCDDAVGEAAQNHEPPEAASQSALATLRTELGAVRDEDFIREVRELREAGAEADTLRASLDSLADAAGERESIAALTEALRAATAFCMPEMSRGPASPEWVRLMQLLDATGTLPEEARAHPAVTFALSGAPRQEEQDKS